MNAITVKMYLWFSQYNALKHFLIKIFTTGAQHFGFFVSSQLNHLQMYKNPESKTYELINNSIKGNLSMNVQEVRNWRLSADATMDDIADNQTSEMSDS